VFAQASGLKLTDQKPPQINGQPSRLANSDLHNIDSGVESAAALKPRATPWFSESIGAPCMGAGILRPYRAGHGLGAVPWHAPRSWRVIVAAFSNGKNFCEAIYEMAFTDFKPSTATPDRVARRD
jgi:hypothetical protein